MALLLSSSKSKAYRESLGIEPSGGDFTIFQPNYLSGRNSKRLISKGLGVVLELPPRTKFGLTRTEPVVAA